MDAKDSLTQRNGHPISFVEIDADDVQSHPDLLERIFGADLTGVVVRNALPQSMVKAAMKTLDSAALGTAWGSPNAGMYGGEIRTIGEAATPTYTSFGGPTAERYTANAVEHTQWTDAIFGDAPPTPHLQAVFSGLFSGRPADPPCFENGTPWLPYNYRALDPGVQIYSHHDNHYGLEIYQGFDAALDRNHLLSWFVTLQPAVEEGDLVIYGLWGSDPNPPMLPTRFLDTEALERDFLRTVVDLEAGDLVIFDSGRHVHRVTPVGGEKSRVTLGGFLTADVDRTRVAFWS